MRTLVKVASAPCESLVFNKALNSRRQRHTLSRRRLTSLPQIYTNTNKDIISFLITKPSKAIFHNSLHAHEHIMGQSQKTNRVLQFYTD